MIPKGHSGYRVELLVDGVPVGEMTMQRTHLMGQHDRITLTGSTRILVKKGAHLTAQVVVERNADGKSETYQALQSGSVLTLERVALW